MSFDIFFPNFTKTTNTYINTHLNTQYTINEIIITNGYYKIDISYSYPSKEDLSYIKYYINDNLLRIDKYKDFSYNTVRSHMDKLDLLLAYDPEIFYRDYFSEYIFPPYTYYLFPYDNNSDNIFEKDQSSGKLIKCDRNYYDYIDCCNQALQQYTPLLSSKIYYYLNEAQLIIFKDDKILHKFNLPDIYCDGMKCLLYGPGNPIYKEAYKEFNLLKR